MRNTKEFIENGIRADCKKYKNRAPGSKNEYAIQKHFFKMLHSWSDRVEIEKFTLHPHAFLGWISLCALIEIAAVCLLWASSFGANIVCTVIGIVLSVVGILMAWFEFFRYREFVDFLFPKRTSHNVYAVRNSKLPPKRRIIFGGHADAAYEFRYIYQANGKLSMPMIYASLTGMALIFLGSVLILICRLNNLKNKVVFYSISCIVSLFVPVFVGMLFFTNWKRVTDGANDNLSGCYAAFAIMKHLKDHNIRFDETEVCCLISGSEEAGLRGAEAFAKAHKKELTDVETVFIAMDTLREKEQLMAYTSGMYGTQKASREVGALLQKAAKSLGVDLPEAPPYPGAMDSDAFSREGLLACGLGAVDHDPKPYYHTRMDTANNIDAECITLCTDICLNAVTLYDTDGLEGE